MVRCGHTFGVYVLLGWLLGCFVRFGFVHLFVLSRPLLFVIFHVVVKGQTFAMLLNWSALIFNGIVCFLFVLSIRVILLRVFVSQCVSVCVQVNYLVPLAMYYVSVKETRGYSTVNASEPVPSAFVVVFRFSLFLLFFL